MMRLSPLCLIAAVAAALLFPLDSAVAQSYSSDSGDYVVVWGEQRDDNGYDFYAQNSHFIPMYISVDFQRLVSLTPTEALPWTGAIEAETERQLLFSLLPTATRGQFGYNLSYTVAEGNPETARHDDDYLYLFPFAHGTRHRITQGHNGRFSHFRENQYAIDFNLDQGTPVYAARDGVVVRVKEDSRVGGPSQAYADRANLIMIAHDDGTFGNYVHLRYRGAEVEVGDEVAAGELIGYSGNTGISSGPHLHFDVRIPLPTGRMQSIPFLFYGLDGRPVQPEEGTFHYAVHPGNAEFEVIRGEDLTVSDFTGHEQEIDQTNRLEFRTEEYDLTYAIFLGNGFSDPIEATVSFNFVNMRADSPLPMELTIPPLTEVFLTLLRADPAGDRWQYAPSVRYRRVE